MKNVLVTRGRATLNSFPTNSDLKGYERHICLLSWLLSCDVQRKLACIKGRDRYKGKATLNSFLTNSFLNDYERLIYLLSRPQSDEALRRLVCVVTWSLQRGKVTLNSCKLRFEGICKAYSILIPTASRGSMMVCLQKKK